MKIKKSLALVMAVISVLSVMLCCPLTASAAYEKDPWHWSSNEPTRAIYYQKSTMKGNDVKWVQAALNRVVNAGLKIDGSFGPACKTATQKFQKKCGLSQDGSFGPGTRSKMIDELNKVGCYKVVSISNGTYIFKSGLNNNYCLDLNGGTANSGTNIQLYYSNNSNAQKFTVTSVGSGWYSIRHAQSKKAVDVAGGVSNKVANIQLYDYNGSSAQQFRFIYSGNGYYYIQNKGGYFIDVSGGKVSNGTNIQVYSGNQSASQKWKLDKTSVTNANGNSWMWPTSLKRTSCGFADSYYHSDHWHRGIDIPCQNGSNVYASKDGKIYNQTYNNARGYWIVIDHGDGTYSEYQHLQKNSYKYKNGSSVKQGDVIAKSGNTGVGGYHLHFEIMNIGKVGVANQYANYWNSYSKYINVNPKNSSDVYCSKSNSSFKIKQKTGSGIPAANLVKSSKNAPVSGMVYCSDNNGTQYIFK